MEGSNYDEQWKRWSYPVGNGHMGANVFAHTDTERLQITHKDFHNDGDYKFSGLTNIAGLLIDFQYEEVSDYRRSLTRTTPSPMPLISIRELPTGAKSL